MTQITAPPPEAVTADQYIDFSLEKIKSLAGPLARDCLGAHFLTATGLGRCLPPQARRIAAARIGFTLEKSYDKERHWTTTPVVNVARSAGIAFTGSTAMEPSKGSPLTCVSQLKAFDANGLLRDFYGVAMVCSKPQCSAQALGWKAPAGSRPLYCTARHHGHPDMAKAFRLSALGYLQKHYPRVVCQAWPKWKSFGRHATPDSPWGNGGPTEWFVQDLASGGGGSSSSSQPAIDPNLRFDTSHVVWEHLSPFSR